MRNISFAMTIPQIVDRSKTVTRRPGWIHLKPGDLLQGVEKAMGLKRGEKVRKLAVIRVVSVCREPVGAISVGDVAREGFPGNTPQEFTAFYCAVNGGSASTFCTRIEFEYVDDAEADQ